MVGLWGFCFRRRIYFYLQSRGIKEEEAAIILSKAFGAEVVQKIKNTEYKKSILHKLNQSEY